MVKLNNFIRTIILLAFCFMYKMVLADVFTAVVKLEFLIKVEQKMVDALGKYMVESMDAGDQVPDSIVT